MYTLVLMETKNSPENSKMAGFESACGQLFFLIESNLALAMPKALEALCIILRQSDEFPSTIILPINAQNRQAHNLFSVFSLWDLIIFCTRAQRSVEFVLMTFNILAKLTPFEFFASFGHHKTHHYIKK
jgi:hypothetical protein